MKRITKVKQREFIKTATDIILSRGAEIVPARYESVRFELSTKAGNLFITIPEDQDYVLTVFMKFDEPKLATRTFKALSMSTKGLNQYSGKYNIHHFEQVDAIGSLSNRLEILTQ